MGSDTGRNSTNCHTTPFSAYKDENSSAICWRGHRITPRLTLRLWASPCLSGRREAVGVLAMPLPGAKKTQIETPRPSTKPAGFVPRATGHYASTTIEIALLSSISCEWVGWRVVHAERWGIGCRERTSLGNLGLQHQKKFN